MEHWNTNKKMMKTNFSRILFLVMFFTFIFQNTITAQISGENDRIGWSADGNQHDPDKPNIILLMADDLGWGDVGFNGNKVIKTPGLDNLAKEGIVYKRFYAASPICSPTRGSCLTGRHPYRFGVLAAHTAGMRQGEITIAEIAQEKGYATGIFGKWHLGYVHPSQGEERGYYSPPSMHGFDETFVTKSAIPTWDPMITPKGWNQWGEKEGEPWKDGEFYYHNGELVTDNLKGDDSRVIMDRVLPFIEAAATKDKPFLACVWFHTPHEPVVAGPEYRAMYAGFPEKKQHYYGCITAMDDQITRLNKELQRMGIKNNTIVFFCSDNGPAKGSAGPYRGGKHTPYEGGLRVPSFAVWPGKIEAGIETDFMAGTVDYFPTLAEIIGYSFPEKQDRPIDGISLLPNKQIIEGERSSPLFSGFRRLHKGQDPKAYIQNQYKLLQNRKGDWELYDLHNDPKETTNLIEQQPVIVSNMRKAIAEAENSIQRSLNGADYEY